MPGYPMVRVSRNALLALAVLCIAACGTDDPTSTSSDSLTVTESTEIAAQVATPVAGAVSGLTPSFTRLASTTIATLEAPAILAAAAIPVDRTTACPGGGTVRSAGTIDGTVAAGGSGSLVLALTETLTSCGITVDGKGLVLQGSPSLAVTGSYIVTNRAPATQQTLRITGTLTVAVSGSRGVPIPCPVDLSVVSNNATRTATITGSACGKSVSKQTSWTP